VSAPPVVKNQLCELDIHGLTHEGAGVGRYKGFTLFVPDALPGERVLAKVVKVRPQYGYAKRVELLQPSPERAEPPCPVYARCGGCHLQHLSYEAQLAFKRQQVVDALVRIGKFGDVPVLPTIGMDAPWGYRNKAQVPVGLADGRVITGFYAPRTHDIVETDHCLIQHPYNDDIVAEARQVVHALGIPVYDESTHTGWLRHIVARVAVSTGETMVVFVANGREVPKQAQLVEELRERIPHLASIMLNVNREKTNVIFGKESYCLWGKSRIVDEIAGVFFTISPRSFYQVNPTQTEVLYRKARDYAALTGTETVIDAYCGIGTISLFVAPYAARVYGIEVVPEAVEDAKANAVLNGIRNAEFLTGRAEEVIVTLYCQHGVCADVVIMDPPRKGCDEALLATVAAMRPRRVVYISCNPSTLARDLRYLADRGYAVEEIQPVDMFPHTYHVECAAKLSLI
jgi:23S rRNA (uracil1939-C5)-methyltransferase